MLCCRIRGVLLKPTSVGSSVRDKCGSVREKCGSVRDKCGTNAGRCGSDAGQMRDKMWLPKGALCSLGICGVCMYLICVCVG